MKIRWGIGWRLAMLITALIVNSSALARAIDASDLYILPNQIEVDSGNRGYSQNAIAVYKIHTNPDKYGPIVVGAGDSTRSLDVLSNDVGANGLSGGNSKLRLSGLAAAPSDNFVNEIVTPHARVRIIGDHLQYIPNGNVSSDTVDQFYYQETDDYSNQTAVAMVTVSLQPTKLSINYDDAVQLEYTKLTNIASASTVIYTQGNIGYDVLASSVSDNAMVGPSGLIKATVDEANMLKSGTWGVRLPNKQSWRAMPMASNELAVEDDILGRRDINLVYGANTEAVPSGTYGVGIIYRITANLP